MFLLSIAFSFTSFISLSIIALAFGPAKSFIESIASSPRASLENSFLKFSGFSRVDARFKLLSSSNWLLLFCSKSKSFTKWYIMFRDCDLSFMVIVYIGQIVYVYLLVIYFTTQMELLLFKWMYLVYK